MAYLAPSYLPALALSGGRSAELDTKTYDGKRKDVARQIHRTLDAIRDKFRRPALEQNLVMPAEAGIQWAGAVRKRKGLVDPGLRGSDKLL